ncbi:kinase-like domain-containing protein [Aspergillus novoparasiticus]|uniref:non-specific serine/threonine protein kinase n=1 Tax=Aspergillus novoparasiticus TaxID=986946 RepID=A0A5N6ERV0_9EURO|nr:kinase-like domain-containing protein [Aspergillus novoparasiticus]
MGSEVRPIPSRGRQLLDDLETVEGHWSGKGRELSYNRTEEPPLAIGSDAIGHGGAGRVVKAMWTHPKNNAEIAFARKSVMPSASFSKKNIKNEIDLLKKLDHHHIVSFVGSYDQDHTTHILLFPCATCDLSALLRELDNCQAGSPQPKYLYELGWIHSVDDDSLKSLPRVVGPRLEQIYGCITSAILYIHNRKVRHKDIKPSNILVDRNTFYLTDFNVSEDFEDRDSTVTARTRFDGTEIYAAPEELCGEERSRKSDIYSLGLVFLEVFTFLMGRSRKDMEDTIGTTSDLGKWKMKLGNDRFHRTYTCSRLAWATMVVPPAAAGKIFGIRDLILGMLAMDPAHRPSAYEVASQLATMDPEGRLHGMCCRRDKDGVGFKALLKRYDRLKEEYEKLSSTYESEKAANAALTYKYDSVKRDLEECQTQNRTIAAELEELKEKLKIGQTGALQPSTNPWNSPDTVTRLTMSRSKSSLSMGTPPPEAPHYSHGKPEAIFLNRNRERLDIEAIKSGRNWDDTAKERYNHVKGLNLCRFSFLDPRGCRNPNCEFKHQKDYSASDDQLFMLRMLTRNKPCENGTKCTNKDCLFGHHCLEKEYPCRFSRNGKCGFPESMHIRDFDTDRTMVV